MTFLLVPWISSVLDRKRKTKLVLLSHAGKIARTVNGGYFSSESKQGLDRWLRRSSVYHTSLITGVQIPGTHTESQMQ